MNPNLCPEQKLSLEKQMAAARAKLPAWRDLPTTFMRELRTRSAALGGKPKVAYYEQPAWVSDAYRRYMLGETQRELADSIGVSASSLQQSLHVYADRLRRGEGLEDGFDELFTKKHD